MLEFGACPLCKLDIAPERKSLRPVICNHCGFTYDEHQYPLADEIERKTIGFMALFSFVIVSNKVNYKNLFWKFLKLPELII